MIKKPRKTGKFYINKKELLGEIIMCRETGEMSVKLANMLALLTKKYASSSQYAGYTFNEDMQAYAMMMLVKTWKAFDPAKSDNPFAFYTQCIKNSFNQMLNKEKKHRNVRDKLLVKHGMTPSFTYQAANESAATFNSDEEDYEQHLTEIANLNKITNK